MHCAACVRRVETAITKTAGVAGARVNLLTGKASVSLELSADIGAVGAAIEKAGFEAAAGRVELSIGGMNCAACSGRVEKALKAVPGVREASVNLATSRAVVEALGGSGRAGELIAAVSRAGYDATERGNAAEAETRERAARDAELARLKQRFLIAAAVALPLVALEMGIHAFEDFHHWTSNTFGERNVRLFALMLASIAQFGPGLDFYRKGWPALMRGGPDMNSLVMLGTSAAYGYSAAVTLFPDFFTGAADGTYFESGAAVIALVLLGRWLEARAKGRAGDAIRKLMSLGAKTARVSRGGAEIDIPIDDLKRGDLVIVRPGGKIPADGIITEGSSLIDEAMITGEPLPAAKSAGSKVTGGTVNKTGAFTFRVERAGSDTLLAEIVRTVEAAQGAKLPVQALVDKVTQWFVPAVLAIAAVTFAAWMFLAAENAFGQALVHAVSVLIIACPCAMGLATPVSILAATGRAAEMGILFRRGDALQLLRDAKVIAFDKTGTLTMGAPALTDIVPAPGFSGSEALALVASLEARSEHPLAFAVISAAKERGIALDIVTEFESLPGLGARGRVSGKAVLAGSARLMAENGISLDALEADAQRLASEGKSPFYAAVDGKLAALMAVSDPVKDTAAEAVRALQAMGKTVVMITGDSRAAAEAVARRLGIDEVIAEVLPSGKAEAVRGLKASSGGRVAFVGDGINDAPALAEADTGIAIGAGTDIAIESADAVLMSPNLTKVPDALSLSRAAMANVLQNLFWAFGYNILLIPVAAGALAKWPGVSMSPAFAGLAMALSSVSVVSNALRLKRFRPANSSRGAA